MGWEIASWNREDARRVKGNLGSDQDQYHASRGDTLKKRFTDDRPSWKPDYSLAGDPTCKQPETPNPIGFPSEVETH